MALTWSIGSKTFSTSANGFRNPEFSLPSSWCPLRQCGSWTCAPMEDVIAAVAVLGIEGAEVICRLLAAGTVRRVLIGPKREENLTPPRPPVGCRRSSPSPMEIASLRRLEVPGGGCCWFGVEPEVIGYGAKRASFCNRRNNLAPASYETITVDFDSN